MQLLLIDGDNASSEWLASRLVDRGFSPRTVASIDHAHREGLFDHVSAILIGVGSPGTKGSYVARAVRAAGIGLPLILLSTSDDWRDAIESLDSGADDYLVKPVRSEEVAARLRAIIRRGTGNPTDTIMLGNLELDLKSRCAWLSGHCLNLTGSEFRLLRLFMLAPNRVMTHREIHQQLNPEKKDFSHNAIEVQIARLRRKVGRNLIRTVRRVGYSFRPETPSDAFRANERDPCFAVQRHQGATACDIAACPAAIGRRREVTSDGDREPALAENSH